MNTLPLNVLLADDDLDDCLFFEEALEELPLTVTLLTANDGVQLMQLLKTEDEELPDVLFLDLNMPRKTGFECLLEIKQQEKLKNLPVIIYSTSLDHEVVNALYEKGAYHYIRKPGEFTQLKAVILKALTAISQPNFTKPPKDKFLIQA